MVISEEEIKIVLERLRVMPKSVKLNIGNYGSYTVGELISEISNKSEIGALIVEMQMAYLRSFKERAKQ